MSVKIYAGDCLNLLKTFPDSTFHSCVTSPPYWNLRDYGNDDEIGSEQTPDEYVARLIGVFREVHRILRDDATLWVNIGDTYQSRKGASVGKDRKFKSSARRFGRRPYDWPIPRLKEKDLVGIPWRLALALQADGWWLRQDIVWSKTNPMPESVKDRFTKSHEYVFLLAKSKRYYFDHEAVKEDPSKGDTKRAGRDVWTLTSRPFHGAHFAVFPPELVEPCVRAGTSEKGACSKCGAPWQRVFRRKHPPKIKASIGGDPSRRDGGYRQKDETWGGCLACRTVATGKWKRSCCCRGAETHPCLILDPFAGAGTTGLVAARLGREAILFELNRSYAKMTKERLLKEGVEARMLRRRQK